MKSKLPWLSIFDQETEKEKNDQTGTQATDCITRPGSGETSFLGSKHYKRVGYSMHIMGACSL